MATKGKKKGNGRAAAGRPERALKKPPGRKLHIFLSFSSEDLAIAESIKIGLGTLEDRYRIEVFFSPELRGGVEYRKAIREAAGKADVFILIYPSESRKLGWCWFELGCFSNASVKHTICIRNPHIKDLPAQVESWQAYKADSAGLRSFFTDLFVNGAFSEGRPVNLGVDSSEHFRKRRDEWVQNIGNSFALARATEKYFPKRISIVDQSAQSKGIDFRKAKVSGCNSAFSMPKGAIEWDFLKSAIRGRYQTVAWMESLEESAALLARGLFGGTLTPYPSGDALVFPVITRVDSFDDVLKAVNVILVEVPRAELEQFFQDWEEPQAIPGHLAGLVRLSNAAIKLRWDCLVPVKSDLEMGKIDAQKAVALIYSGLMAVEKRMEPFFRDAGQVKEIYEGENTPMVKEAMEKYPEVRREVVELHARLGTAAKAEITAAQVVGVLNRLKAANMGFLKACSNQFNLMVERFSQD